MISLHDPRCAQRENHDVETPYDCHHTARSKTQGPPRVPPGIRPQALAEPVGSLSTRRFNFLIHYALLCVLHILVYSFIGHLQPAHGNGSTRAHTLSHCRQQHLPPWLADIIPSAPSAIPRHRHSGSNTLAPRWQGAAVAAQPRWK